MWHRFGQGLGAVVQRAATQAEARDLSTRHLLWALVSEETLPAAKMMHRLGVALPAVQKALEQLPTDEASANGDVPTLTPEARKAVECAYSLAANLGDEYIGGEHLLLAFAHEPDGSDAGRVLAKMGVTWGRAGQMLMEQQRWRTQAPEGVSLPGLGRRRLVRLARGKARRVKHVAYGLTHFQTPFMPYLLFRKRTTDNPYPFYTRLRCRPAYWDPLMSQWVVTRYQDVVAALAETRLSQRVYSAPAWAHDNLPPLIEREFRCLQNNLDRQMLFQDAPDQSRQRQLLAKRFTPRVIAQMQEQMQQAADEILDGIHPAGRMEVITDLAVPFPLLAIARMLGLPSKDLSLFKKWSNDYFKYLTFETTLGDDLAAYCSVREASAYFQNLLPARRLLSPGDANADLISLLLQPGSEGECLPEEDVIANCLLLLATGHENTTRLISSGLLALLRHPAQWQALCEDPALIGPAVEELLRFDSPVQWTLRYMQEDLEWRGVALKKGQRVQIGIGPANRDPAQFPDPDRLDIRRAENRHIAFGHGPHFCLGAALARLETQVVFRSLTARFPGLHLIHSPKWRQEGLAFRGLQDLHVGWRSK